MGGLDAYVQSHGHKAPPPGVGLPGADYPTYAHVTGTLTTSAPGITSATSTMSVYGPHLPSTFADHSLSQVWLYSGSNTGVEGSPCTSNCVKSIEVGWDVDDDINSGDVSTPHLFLFSTDDGYTSTGCYNNVPSDPLTCVPWVPSTSSAFALNQALAFDPPANTGGQDPQPGPVEMTTAVVVIGGTPCTPTASCASAGATCGTISDGCGDTLSCGTCSTADECSANQCICKPKACAVGSTWDSSTCSCEVTKVCHTPEQCCVMAGGDWNGHECF